MVYEMKKVFLGLMLAVCGFAQINVPLTVRETLYPGSMSGVARTNEPLTVGVPLPDSAGIINTSTFGLTGATAAQFSVEGTWPDGNIKWVKVRAIVPSVSAGGTATINLTNSGSGNFGGPNLAVDNGATITVTTGTATFTIKKANFDGVDQAVIGNTTLVASGSSAGLVILGPNPGAAYPGNVTCLPTAGGTACTTVYSSANDPNSTAVIEENGPAMAVIKATGSHVDANGNVYMHFTARMYFYQNQSYVKVTSILRNADYGKSATFASAYKGFQGYELRIHPNLGGTLNYTIGNHTAAPTTGSLNAAGGTDSAYIYQAESSLMNNNGGWCQGTGCVPYTTLTGYSIVNNGSAQLTGAAAQAAAGWADISAANGAGIEIGQYQFAPYGNKSLEFNGGGTDVRIGIWARENNTTSTSSATQNQPYYMPWPQWSINDVYLNFHAGPDSTLSSDFLKLQHYLVAAAAPAYYNTCNVFFEPLLDPTEESTYYNSVASSASPAVTAPSIQDLGTVDTYNWPLNAWRYYPWPTGGVSNQMEFRLTHVQDFLRRGFTGNYLDSAHFYKFIAEKAFPMSDGFNWRTSPATDTQYVGYPVATSANSTLGIKDWVEPDEEHSHWYGMPDYYFLSGDETIHDGIIEGPKDSFLNNISAGSSTTSEVTGGWFWAARSVGVVLMSDARLYSFLQATGDPDAPIAAQNGQTVYNLQVQPNFCVAGDPSGCTPDPYDNNSGFGTGGKNRQRGTSSVRGVPYTWGDTIEQAGCPTNPTSVRDESVFMTGILLQGLWEFRQALGPSWANYNQAFDLGYGMSMWAFSEMYADNGSSSWAGNGFRYKEALDFPNACNVGSGGSVNDFYWMVQNPNAYWPVFLFRNQYEGGTTAAALQRQFNQSLQNVISGGSAIKDELYHYTVGEVIYAFNHPSGAALSTAPITGFTSSGSSYTITWNVPAGATSYRIKWGPRAIVDWIGFDPGANVFLGNPATTMNWFAATDATGIPTPSGTTQSLTINTGVAGLTAANFMVKVYTGGSVQTAPPPALPAVSMTSPVAGATVSGTVTLSATASSGVGVSTVQFRLDGANLGSPILGAGPLYSASWDTTTATNAAHVLSALVTDTAGNTALSTSLSVTVNNANAAPVITNVTVSSTTSSSATIMWTTSVAADSQVAYGPTAAYGSLSTLTAPLVMSHAVTISGLTSSALYHFQVMSHNALGTLGTSPDSTLTTSAPAQSGGAGGTAIPQNTWTAIPATGWPAEILNYDKSEYVSSRKLHCIWGAYKQWLSSEHNNALVCYSYSQNTWQVMENNGYWHSSHSPGVGHSVSVFAYMPDKDAIAFQADGSGSNSPENFVGLWWWYDVAGLSGQDREFTPRPWVGVLTPLVEMMTYDTSDKKLIMYDQSGAIQVCDPNTNVCAKPAINGIAPPTNLTSPNMVYDTNNNSMYIFGGGQADMYTVSCTTNACTTMTGAKLTVTCTGAACVNGKPPVRLAAGMAYSTADNVIMMVGGINFYGTGDSVFNDTWIFNPSTLAWTQLSPANGYPDSTIYFTADRLTYDQDSNTFILMAVNGYTPLIYAYPYSAALNYGRVTSSTTPPAGSMNRVQPSATNQSWAFDPAITSSGSQVYMGWIESGAPSDNSNCGQTHHPYIQSGANSTVSYFPAGAQTQASACAAIDPDLSGSTNDSRIRLGVVNGTLWEAHEKINTNQNFYSSAFAQHWTGSAWSGGAVGCFFATCGTSLRQTPQAIIGVGSTPTLATIEWNHATYTPEGYIYVSQWNGTAWTPLGAKLNINGAGSQALDAVLATNGATPAACWAEQVSDVTRTNITTTPQIQCAQWNGSSWARLGSTSLNQNPSSWASDPTMTYANGSYYVGWVERTTAGNNNLYVCQWNGSSCNLLGPGALNVTAGTSWAAHPSLATDGINVYVAWDEQPALGQHSMGYMKQWNGSGWTQIGGAVNADPVNGSVEGISLAVVGTKPTAIWGELTYGNLRQSYSKQWNGTAWTAVAPPATTCDLNGDGSINLADIQLAVNQAVGVSLCTTADLRQNGQCSVIDVQRVVAASMGGGCLIGQ